MSGSEVRGAVADFDEADAFELHDDADDLLPLLSSMGDRVLGAGVTKFTVVTGCSALWLFGILVAVTVVVAHAAAAAAEVAAAAAASAAAAVAAAAATLTAAVAIISEAQQQRQWRRQQQQ